MKEMFLNNKGKFIVLGLQSLASIILIINLSNLGILSSEQFGLVIIIVIILLLLMLLMQRKPSKGINTTGKVISIFLTIILCVVTYFVVLGNGLLNKISDQGDRFTTLSVITLADSKAETLDDVSGKVYYSIISKDLVEENANHYADVKLVSKKNYLTMARDLLDEDIDYIIIDEAQRSFIEENVESFAKETKVIDEFKVQLKSKDSAKNVDLEKDAINIYISGIDSYGSPSVSSRTDSNMILTYNPKTGEMLLTSIPRDYYLPLACAGGEYDKFTHSGLYGIDCSVETLEQLFGIDINYYVRVNFTGFINIIDALGGVDVYSPVAFSSSGGQYYFPQGNQTLTSDAALAFSRERYNLPGGDNARVMNQQLVVMGVLQKIASPAIVSNFGAFIESIQGSIVTNMPADQISKLLQLQLKGVNATSMDNFAVTGYGQNSYTYSIPNMLVYVMVPDQNSVDEAISKMKNIIEGK